MPLFLSIALTFITNLLQLGGNPQVVYQKDNYERVALTDSTTMEVCEYADSVLVVITVCAPQCSSCARVYNKEGQVLRTITPPFTSIFPLATIENGRLVWRDNDTWNYQSTL